MLVWVYAFLQAGVLFGERLLANRVSLNDDAEDEPDYEVMGANVLDGDAILAMEGDYESMDGLGLASKKKTKKRGKKRRQPTIAALRNDMRSLMASIDNLGINHEQVAIMHENPTC